ncbi:MAG: prolyl oligopeptidase family serine peptidase, partial [Treponema sp.]|nr:prolyl oligopeptidase family serine peptidase [Treponema sp.]
FNYATCGTPRYCEGAYYAWRHDGVQNQSVFYRSFSLDEIGEPVLDPNPLSEDGTVAVGSYAVSPKGRYLAYGLSSAGSDCQEIKVRDMACGKDLPDTIGHCKFPDQIWLPDESGFIYTRFPEQKSDSVLEHSMMNQVVCLHILGQKQSEDRLLHKDDEHPEYLFDLCSDEDDKWLFLSVVRDTLPVNQLYYKPMAKLDSPWLTISPDFEGGYDVIGVIDGMAYIKTQKDAPFGKIMRVGLGENGISGRETIVPDRGESLEWATLAGDHILCHYLNHAVSGLKLYDQNGNFVRDIELPAPGTVSGVSAKRHRQEFFIQFTSYLYPSTVLRCDISTAKPTTWFAPKIDFPFDDYHTIQEFYVSKDGTRVPIFITMPKSVGRNGANPLLLYGYGGFTASMTPGFAPGNLAWLERGGIYAVACIRGGDEYGEAWHRAGMLESKQNTFDDFIAAAEYLIAEKYTGAQKLAIEGRSNGGLLAAACLTQRPDLFGAAIVGVPVVDMLRFHLFTAGRLWTGEYGCAEDPNQFPFMYKYSPLHNVRANTVYPATLIMTADTDDRVVPGQARKFAATLQAADGGENPILIRIEKSAGHGGGKPLGKAIEEKADKFTFLFANLCGGK